MSKRYLSIHQKLLSWFEHQGRHDLPWRQNFSPYEVLVSEFMLQQTTVATITPRFQAWMKLFPTIEVLAEASEDQVLSAWQGLGYYARARRLHGVARTVVEKYEGAIPCELEKLLALPGIGPYTAKAILAFAFDQPVEVLDTNIIRVVARLNNVTEAIDTKIGRQHLEQSAQEMLLRKERGFAVKEGRAFASALMDLGATICIAGEPQCEVCPLVELCEAQEPASLPRKQPRAAVTQKKEQRAFYQCGENIYLEQSSGPLWKGLWILPICSSVQKPRAMLSSISYPITRYRVKMELYRPEGPIPTTLHPFAFEELEGLAIPSPHRKAIATLVKFTK